MKEETEVAVQYFEGLQEEVISELAAARDQRSYHAGQAAIQARLIRIAEVKLKGTLKAIDSMKFAPYLPADKDSQK